jgi:hypothetical protein
MRDVERFDCLDPDLVGLVAAHVATQLAAPG